MSDAYKLYKVFFQDSELLHIYATNAKEARQMFNRHIIMVKYKPIGCMKTGGDDE